MRDAAGNQIVIPNFPPYRTPTTIVINDDLFAELRRYMAFNNTGKSRVIEEALAKLFASDSTWTDFKASKPQLFLVKGSS